MSSSAVRAALVASVSVRLAAGEMPEQIRVDRAEGELARFCGLARVRHIVEQPRDLGRREIRIEQQAGARRSRASRGPRARASRRHRAVRRSCQTIALWIGLPVARSQMIVVSRWLVMPIAATSLGRDRRRFAIAARAVATAVGPDVLRVVLDPAGRGIDLRKFELREAHRRQRLRRTGTRASRSCPDRWQADE